MIHFEEVTNKNVRAVCRLRVADEQKSFVAENVLSLAEAYATRNEGNYALPYAIYNDGTLIGFVMIGYGTCDEQDPEIAKDNYILWRLMLDKAFQHQGFAKEILERVISLVKSAPYGAAEYIWLSYEPENIRAKEIYNKFGFRENGEICGGEIVAVYKL